MLVQRALDGDPGVGPPRELLVSRICEEFGCLPSVAERELLDGDSVLLFDVLALRSYLRAKAQLDGATRQGDVPMTPAVRQVLEVRIALLAARRPDEPIA